MRVGDAREPVDHDSNFTEADICGMVVTARIDINGNRQPALKKHHLGENSRHRQPRPSSCDSAPL